jgi:hypothetical protein
LLSLAIVLFMESAVRDDNASALVEAVAVWFAVQGWRHRRVAFLSAPFPAV